MSGLRVGKTYPSRVQVLPPRPVSRNVGLPQRGAVSVSRSGAGDSGTLSNWYPSPIGSAQEGRERELIALRSRDLQGSNPHAAGLIDTIGLNSVGSGLIPQSQPNFKRLGIPEEQVRELAETFEWEFKLWSREAVAEANHSPLASAMDFGFRTLQNIVQMLVTGEFVNLPLWVDEPGRRYSFALQSVDPIRMRTPLGLRHAKGIRDGIRLGNRNQPLSYFVADPDNGIITSSLDLRHYREYPAMVGHRPGLIHRFVPKQGAEQVRGIGALAAALKPLKDSYSYIDYELVGAIVAANFPVWIERQQQMMPNGLPNVHGQQLSEDDYIYFENLMSGGMHYGNPGEKPHIMTPREHSNTFAPFMDVVVGAIGASAGISREQVTKDFSKTNYSSARAGMLESYRVFSLNQDWLIRGFLNMIWRMVLEEAVLREYVQLPGGLDSFYDNIDAWTNVTWTRPKRGSIDPVKDAMAFKILNAIPGGTTLADFHGESGRNWEDQVMQGAREVKALKDAGLWEEEETV